MVEVFGSQNLRWHNGEEVEEGEDKGGGGGEAGLRGDQVEGKGKGNQVDGKEPFCLLFLASV